MEKNKLQTSANREQIEFLHMINDSFNSFPWEAIDRYRFTEEELERLNAMMAEADSQDYNSDLLQGFGVEINNMMQRNDEDAYPLAEAVSDGDIQVLDRFQLESTNDEYIVESINDGEITLRCINPEADDVTINVSVDDIKSNFRRM